MATSFGSVLLHDQLTCSGPHHDQMNGLPEHRAIADPAGVVSGSGVSAAYESYGTVCREDHRELDIDPGAERRPGVVVLHALAARDGDCSVSSAGTPTKRSRSRLGTD